LESSVGVQLEVSVSHVIMHLASFFRTRTSDPCLSLSQVTPLLLYTIWGSTSEPSSMVLDTIALSRPAALDERPPGEGIESK
jgi:hypothetical protein